MSDSNRASLKRKAPEHAEASSAASVPKLEGKLVKRQCPSHYETSFKKIKNFRIGNELTDFILKIDGKEIPVHKVILAASSKYFGTMFSRDFKENKDGFVEIKEVDSLAVKLCINFIYTGEAFFTHSLEFAEKLIHASELFQLTDLTDLYFEFLKEKVSVKNCLQYVGLAKKYSKRLFASFFQNFSHKNFEEIIHCDDFLGLTNNVFEDLLSNFPTSDPDLEILKWEGIKLWINNDEEDRGQYTLGLLRYVSLEHLPHRQLQEIANEPIVQQSQEFKDSLFKALTSINITTDVPDVKKDATHIVVCNNSSRLVLAIDINTKKWSRFTKIPDNLSLGRIDMVCIKTRIYLTTVDSVYSQRNGEFSVLCKFSDASTSATEHGRLVGSSHHRSIVHGELIYIITNERIVKFNTRTTRYTFMKKLLPFTSSFFVAASNTHIYAIAQGHGTARVMSFSGEVWEFISSLVDNNYLKDIFWHNSKLYGININGLVHYDYEADMWRKEGSDYHNENYYRGLSIQGEIYVVGEISGISKYQGLSTVQFAPRIGLNPRLACTMTS